MNNKDFNAAQLEAIRHYSGPAMVLAGPGSGKTAVITHRLLYLIKERRVPPSSILVITFTKAAAIEMQIRFMKLTDSSYPEVSFGTFHSIFYQIIRSSVSGHDSKIEIAPESFKYEIIKDILSSLYNLGKIGKIEYEDSLEDIPEIISEISRVKNLGIAPEECSKSLRLKHCFPDVFDAYNRSVREFGKIDFDDMIVRCYEILRDNKSILETWQKRFEYILIDEYQDINPMQYKVVSLLSEKQKNLFVVGDDDQSIYGFRGSDPGIMLEFNKALNDQPVKIINLNMNYRCGKDILTNALKVIDENTVRFRKNLTASPINGSGFVAARKYENRKKETDAIVFFLSKHMEELSEIAILSRTNSESEHIALALRQAGIPSNIENHDKSFFADKAVKLCVAYISFACNGKKRSDYYKIINEPMRYISRDSAEKEYVSEVAVLKYYRGNGRRQDTVRKFFSCIRMIEHLRPSLAIRYIRKTVGIDNLYQESKNALDEFEKYGAKFENNIKLLADMEEKISAESESKKNDKKKMSGNRVNLLTMHASKGLEFKYVWLPDLNEGIIPSRNATELHEIEEERRMLYVAMTRAKQALIMSYITGNRDNPMLPSRFLRPIKNLWDQAYTADHSSSESSPDSSSGRSTSSSYSASSR